MTASRGPRVTLGVLWFGALAYSIQQTLVFPALPVLQRDLHTRTEWVTWVSIGFLLVSSAVTPIMGRLGDQFGKKRILVIALTLFFLGSLGASFAPNIAIVIACRAFGGLGGAVFPLSYAIIRDEFPPERVGAAFGVLATVFAVGGGVGVVASGLIVDHLSWRLLFGLGAVPAGLAALGVALLVPESPSRVQARVDVLGAVLLGGGLAALLLAVTEGNSWGWGSGRVLALVAAGFALLIAWALVEQRVADPMIDIRMLSQRGVLLTNIGSLLGGGGMFVVLIVVPMLVQLPSVAGGIDYGFGASTTETALYLLPGMMVGFFTGAIGGVIGRRLGRKWPLVIWSAINAIGIVMLALWHDERWQIVTGLVVCGFAAPGQAAAVATLIVGLVRPTETGVATSMTIVMRVIGAVIGTQVAAAILAADTFRGTGLPAESAFTTIFWLCAAISGAACLVGLAIPSQARLRAAVEARAARGP